MKISPVIFVSVLAWIPVQTAIAKDYSDCGPLRAFVASVKPDETRSFAFRTFWGGSFKDEKEEPEQFVFYSKRCEDQEYAPAKAVCADLMENGSVEFADGNLKQVVNCLSKESWLEGVWFEGAVLSLNYGTEDRGANVDIELAEDPEVGGMVLRVTANGY